PPACPARAPGLCKEPQRLSRSPERQRVSSRLHSLDIDWRDVNGLFGNDERRQVQPSAGEAVEDLMHRVCLARVHEDFRFDATLGPMALTSRIERFTTVVAPRAI